MVRIWFVLAIGLCLVPAAGAREPGIPVKVTGGTVPGMPSKASARLDLSDPDFMMLQCRGAEVRVPYRKINTLEYGQNVSRRYAAALISPVLLLSKSREHFVTLGYEDGEGRQEALVLRVGKGDIRSVLASLESRTGRRVEYEDDDARKAGK